MQLYRPNPSLSSDESTTGEMPAAQSQAVQRPTARGGVLIIPEARGAGRIRRPDDSDGNCDRLAMAADADSTEDRNALSPAHLPHSDVSCAFPRLPMLSNSFSPGCTRKSCPGAGNRSRFH